MTKGNPARRALLALAAGAALGAALVTMPASATERTFKPDGQFSILFAPKATVKDLSGGNIATRTWTGRDDDIYYGVSQSTSNTTFDAPKELAANFTNFIAQVHAKVLKQERKPWQTSHGPVPALLYAFTLPSGKTGQGVFVVSGNTIYGAVAVDYKTPAREDRLSAVVNSLKVFN